MHRPLVGRLLDHPDDLVALLRRSARRWRTRSRRASPRPGWRRRAPASGRGSRSRRRTAWRPRARGRCSRCSAAARPSRRSSRTSLLEPGLLAHPRRRAGTSAAATRAAARTRCPGRARAWRRTRRGGADASKMGSSPDVWDADRREHPATHEAPSGRGERRQRDRRRTDHDECNHVRGRRPHQGGRHRRPDRPALVRRRSRTPTWPGWSSTTSTPRAACWAGPCELHLEDSATDDARRGRQGRQARRAGPGRRHLRRHLQLHAAGHQGPGRRGGPDALHLPRAVRGAGVRPAHLLHRPGAGAAGRPVHPVADARDRGARRSTCRRPTTSGRTS